MLKEIIKLIKPEKKIQIDSFEWYEELVWMSEVQKIKNDKRFIYVDSYYNDETEKYYIEYFIK
ncbi:hypothetical protein [Macrococcus capreoli]|uniref:hypothetical protein n=1 Tax=Macrococcus capreoli TaxID=2982690 RepID=UPI0021D598B6|nr:hypothetical protein [Macrococcus sp. TMW 2.2395]MCU7557288.1 hypothetical protein [Macrococcus sp. TMW 2.2395]